ncbi:hypothetical protein Tco_0453889 [Tanacetum coccineum]
MALLKYCDKHNQVGFLRKPDESVGFAEIVDFLRGSNLRYALTNNPTIHDSLVKQFWQTATAKTLADGTLELKATIDTIEYTITEASIRISKSGGWDQFGSNIATALICLSTGRVYNFSKLIFDGMVANLKSKTKFLMYPRFLQMILDIQTENKHPYLAVTLTKKIFGNMKRGFKGVPRPLLPAMLSIVDPSAGQEAPSVTQPQPSSTVVPPTPPTTQPIPSEATTIPPLTQPAPPTPIAETTTASPSPSPSPAHEPMEHTFEQHQMKTTTVKLSHFGGKSKDFGGCFEKKDQEELVTPSKTINASGEEQVEDISPTTLEAAAILTKVQKIKSVDKGKRYKRRKSSKESAGTGLDFEEVKSAFEEVNTGGIKVSAGIEEINAGSLDVNTGIDPVTTDSIRVSVPSPDRGRREGKAPMTEEEETQASRKTKEQILQEEAGLAEAIRLDALEKALEKEEVAKQVHLDSLLAQRMAEEQELTEEQKKRKAQVQFEAQSYTEEDWDTIRAKLEANAELKESVLGKDLTVEDYAKRMVELVNQRRKHFAEERARAKRNKPMTQTQLRNYMSNFLKNQGTWKLTQLKKLNFEEVKAEFEKLVKQLDTYVPMNFEATKESLKRFSEELQTKTAKKLKFDDEGTQPTEEKIEEDKDDTPTKKTGKRRKQIARKGFHTGHDKDESEDSDEANKKDDSTSAMLTGILRDDLTELYRIVMKKHGMNEPEDEFEKRYYDACRVHCLNLESADVYMLIERKYPLSAEVCKAMLDKKLQGGKPDKDCYKLLKMMEKHKDWLVQEQTTLGKDFSNPFMADNLLKIVIRLVCKSISLRSVIRIDHQELKKVIWYVLHNSPEIDTYLVKFKIQFPNKDMKEEFPNWFGSQIRQRHVDKDPSVSASSELFALACGPTQTPISVNSCIVNGVRFIVHNRDEHRTTQNSGICSPGDKDGEILNDLDFETLHIDGQSMDVDAPPDIIEVDEDDDIIDEEDALPYDLADSDDEDLVNDDDDHVAVMLADVARGHSGDGGSDDCPPPHQIGGDCQCKGTRKPNLGGRKASRLNIRKETETSDRQGVLDALPFLAQHPGREEGEDPGKEWAPHAIRSQELEKYQYGHPAAFGKDLHRQQVGVEGEALDWDAQIAFWSDPKNVARCAKNKLNFAKSTVICRHGSWSLAVLRDMQMQSFDTQEYPSLIQTYFDTHTVDGVFLQDEERLLYGLGSNTSTRVPYTDDEIMTIIRGAKQRGHIHGVGQVLACQGMDVIIPPEPRCTHTTDVDELKKTNKARDDEPGDDEDADKDEEDEDS